MIFFKIAFGKTSLYVTYNELLKLCEILDRNKTGYAMFINDKPLKDIYEARSELIKATKYADDDNPFLNRK